MRRLDLDYSTFKVASEVLDELYGLRSVFVFFELMVEDYVLRVEV